MKDVSGIDLKNVKLLVLSACQTALSGNISGAEVYGFAYQFERSGVGNVLASLWNVNDRSTSIIMKHFYSEIEKNPNALAKALQTAQIKMINSNEYNNPYYWAPFI